MMDADAQLITLTRGTVDVHALEELRQRLRAGRPLAVKAGFDPTRPDLHLGHVVLLTKMRQFQELGHQVTFVVGDFTAQIGDPSGRSATRPVPTREEIEEGAASYAAQAFKILDRDQTKLVFNSAWLGKMAFDDVLRLAGKYTLARMLERDDFRTRYREHQAISLHELLYPLAQGYDSVVLAADVELGGTDQLFNLLVGRDLMREYGQRPQIVMTTPILEGLSARAEDGRIVGDKMSKSLDNYVGINEPPEAQFGKIMSIADEVMWRYYELLSAVSEAERVARKRACTDGTMNPRDAKLCLAQELVARFWGQAAAEQAQAEFLEQFSRGEVPSDMPAVAVTAPSPQGIWLPKALVHAGLVTSTSEGRRRIEQGAVRIDGERVSDTDAHLVQGEYVIRAGKRAWARLEVR